MSLPVTPAYRGHSLGGLRQTNPAYVIAGILVVVTLLTALYLGRDVLIPLALAILLAFVLAPIAISLRRVGLGRGPSVAVVVLGALAVIGTLGWVVSGQMVQLAESLPSYESNLRQKLSDLGETVHGESLITRLTHLATRLESAIQTDADGAAAANVPLTVQVATSSMGQLGTSLAVIQYVLHALMLPALVLLFLTFILLQREDLRDRLIRLAGPADIHRTTQMMNDAAERVARYLTAQLMVNVIYGVSFGLALLAIGVPSAALWGTLGTALRFVPYVGAPLSALLPLTLALAIDTGWAAPVQVLVAFLVIEAIIAHILEPLFYGARTGLSPLALLVASAFWTLIWGPIGLILAPPLLVCLIVLGRHVPQLEFLDVLFGNRPPLPPDMSIYQRLLAGDRQRALEIAETIEEKTSLVTLHDGTLVQVLGLAEEDRRRDTLPPVAHLALLEQLREMVEQLADEPDEVANAPTVLCIGARGAADDAAAMMMGQLLEQEGYRVERSERPAVAPLAVILTMVGGLHIVPARRRIRRLKMLPGTPLIVVVLAVDAGVELNDEAKPLAPTRLCRSLADAVATVGEVVPRPEPAELEPSVAVGGGDLDQDVEPRRIAG